MDNKIAFEVAKGLNTQTESTEKCERDKKDRKNKARRERHEALLDLGLKRVKGALGSVYYE